jgi:hypothetical protein
LPDPDIVIGNSIAWVARILFGILSLAIFLVPNLPPVIGLPAFGLLAGLLVVVVVMGR